MSGSRFFSSIRRRASRNKHVARRNSSSDHSPSPASASGSTSMGNTTSASVSAGHKHALDDKTSTNSSAPHLPRVETLQAVSDAKGTSEGRAHEDAQASPRDARPPNGEAGGPDPLLPSDTSEVTNVTVVEGPVERIETRGRSQEAVCREGEALHMHGWTPGMYVLLNAQSGTALDLSGGDQRTLICLPAHMGPNQQWEFIPSGKGYTIRSACPSSRGLYLTVEDIHDNAPIVASPFPASWNVLIDEKEETIRISWPNTNYMLDLSDGRNAEPGAKVQLMKEKPGEHCQTWRYIRCRPAEEQWEKVAESTSKPIISETVIVAEGKDSITTTRTTTTTLITTVTTVARTAR